MEVTVDWRNWEGCNTPRHDVSRPARVACKCVSSECACAALGAVGVHAN